MDRDLKLIYIYIFLIFRFEVDVKFSIPNIIIEPPLGSVSNALNLLARSIIQVPQGEIS